MHLNIGALILSLPCLGYNAYGAVGDGTTTTPRDVPTPVMGNYNWTSLPKKSESYFTCGIQSRNQTLWCWVGFPCGPETVCVSLTTGADAESPALHCRAKTTMARLAMARRGLA